MKICVFYALLAAAFATVGLMKLTGCNTRHNVDNVNRIFYYGGAGAAIAMNETLLAIEKRAAIHDVFVDIKASNPEVGQTLEAAWMPIAQKHSDILVAEGKIDAGAGVTIMAGFSTVMAGVSLLEQHHPEIREDRDLMSAAIAGFTDGFLERFIVEPEVASNLPDEKDSPVFSVANAVRKEAARNNLK